MTAILVVFLRPNGGPCHNGPSHNGHSLSHWLTVYDQSPFNSPDSVLAREALLHIGTNAVPDALRWFEETTPEGWSPHDEPRGRGERAVKIFELLGPAAIPAIPQLVQLAGASAVGSPRALASLVAIGPPGVSGLLSVITNKQALNRCQALYRLRDVGLNAIDVLPALLSCLEDTGKEVALSAFVFLIQLKPQSPVFFNAVTNQLESPDVLMRSWAINALGKSVADARPAIPALLRRLSDQDAKNRRYATRVLKTLAPDLLTNAPPDAPVNP